MCSKIRNWCTVLAQVPLSYYIFLSSYFPIIGGLKLCDITADGKATMLTSSAFTLPPNNVVLCLDTNWDKCVAGFWNGDLAIIDY